MDAGRWMDAWTYKGHSHSGVCFKTEKGAAREAPVSESEFDCEHCDIIAYYCLL